jgi:hypothetical protein
MLEAHDPGVACVLSRDGAPRSGARRFALFDTATEAFNYAEQHRGTALCEVLEVAARPCRMYFVIDRADGAFADDVIAVEFLGAFSSFLSEKCDLKLDVSPGSTDVQVSSASTGATTTLHIVADILVGDLDALKRFTKSLENYILAEDASYPSLVIGGKCVVDTCAYSQFRSHRMLHMVKSGRDIPLKPIRGSSDSIADHSINIFADRPTPQFTLPAAVSNWPARGLPWVSRSSVPFTTTPASPSQLHDLETLVNGWNSVKATWPDGVVVVAGSVSNRGSYFLYLHYATVCPYTGVCHPNTRVILLVYEDKHSAKVSCCAEDCQMEIICGKEHMMLYANNIGDV